MLPSVEPFDGDSPRPTPGLRCVSLRHGRRVLIVGFVCPLTTKTVVVQHDNISLRTLL